MSRYLIRVANAKKYNRHQVGEVASEFQERISGYGVILRNFRVSEYAIEFDLFSGDTESKVLALEAIKSGIGRVVSERNLTAAEIFHTKEEVVSEVVKLFNEQRYWECHESLESIWRTEANPKEKAVQQGVILFASALVHAQKDEDVVCLNMVGRALAKLAIWSSDKYFDLNILSLKESMQYLLATGCVSFPKV